MGEASNLTGGITVFLLYMMLGVPFAVWSARASRASTAVLVEDRPRGRPGQAATVFLLVLPLLFVAYYFLSGVGAVTGESLDTGVGTAVLREPSSEWGAYAFLALAPASGLILGYLSSFVWAQNAGPGQLPRLERDDK